MNKNSDGSNPDPKLHPQTEMATVYGNLKQKVIFELKQILKVFLAEAYK